jgi:hypothetical protein
MDDSFRSDGNDATAMLVRQFSPSRIEGELLAQAFELLCSSAAAVDCDGSSVTKVVNSQDSDEGPVELAVQFAERCES